MSVAIKQCFYIQIFMPFIEDNLLVFYLINFENKKNNDGENFYGLRNNFNFFTDKKIYS